MSYTRVGVVTGANKGIGFAIVRNLALQYPNSPLNNGPLLIYLTARDSSRGQEALRRLQDDSQLKQAKALTRDGGLAEIKYHALDIAHSTSIASFAEYLKNTHGDGVDFVINNAAIAMQGFDANVVKTTLGCNYYGTLEASSTFLPRLKESGRLVNLASMSGRLSQYSDGIRDEFLASKTVSDVTKLMEAFASAVEAGNEKKQGWPSAAYAVSKSGVISMTRAVAAAEKAKGSKVLINSCCPGWVQTDMTKGRGAKTPDEGAQTAVMLALEDIMQRTGLFWQNERPIHW
ncbi:carbonyl reductase [Mytilinidion resinicola]|uniref:Carbonyl reductase n=1 Tax=Mytilinidion resinicola TaxID=574789 RepID=A0A6A6YLD2_9PEZI|nr:carbonyl reductase [Mytilinidion resinicola]KAF2808677.1 carbonyl reductase [Mytilinidion resinicola]